VAITWCCGGFLPLFCQSFRQAAAGWCRSRDRTEVVGCASSSSVQAVGLEIVTK
jgi:hypothetical protein